MARYLKSITALVTGWIGWGAVVVASAPPAVTASEWLGLAVVTATGLGVYAVPNGADATKAAAATPPRIAPLTPAPDPSVWNVPDAPAKKATRVRKAAKKK